MVLTPLQIVAILFALFALSRALLLFKENKISFKELLFWAIIWIGVIIFSLSKRIMGMFAEFTGLQRPIDALLIISVILLFYLIYRIYAKFDKVEQNITLLVRKTAYKKKK